MGKFESLIFYIISFIISFAFYALYTKKQKKIFLFISFFIPFIIGGFRNGVGTDYKTYVSMYNNHKGLLSFRIISHLSSYLLGVRTLFLFYQFLILLFMFLGLNNLDKRIRPFAFLCYLFLYYTSGFNIMKQALAMSIVFYAYKFIMEKDFKKWTIFILIASFFHQTSLLFFFLYFIFTSSRNSFKFISLILIFLISINYSDVVLFFGRYPFFSKYVSYANDYTNIISNKTFFLELLILLYFLFLRKNLIKINPDISTYIYIYTLGVVLMVTGFYSPYVKRIANYLLISKIVVIPYIPFLYQNGKKRLLNYIVIFCCLITIFILVVYVLEHSNIVPYSFSLY